MIILMNSSGITFKWVLKVVVFILIPLILIFLILSNLSLVKFFLVNSNTYTECGCGCCGGSNPLIKCLDKSLGENLESIKAKDQLQKGNNGCMAVGCSYGIKYAECDNLLFKLGSFLPETPVFLRPVSIVKVY